MAIYEAIKNNDLQGVIDFIDDINLQNENGQSPLHFAIGYNKLDIAKYLIDKGANVNLQNILGDTPLCLAIVDEKPDIAKYLIEKGANINLQNNNGLTPLHLAIQFELLEIVECLIGKGANSNIKNVKGETPLDFAQKFALIEEMRQNMGHIIGLIIRRQHRLNAVDAPNIETEDVSDTEIWKKNFKAQIKNAENVNTVGFTSIYFWQKPIKSMPRDDCDESQRLDINNVNNLNFTEV
ncbi:MAG: ankyrin repeat domain-containing protein [Legionellales bacterium]|nr:ankyrin repeat domain-containing protein [Legionellales bacterium]